MNGGQMPDWLIPAAAGVPSGVPSIPNPGTNMALRANTTNGHLYAYIAGAWMDVTGAGGSAGGALITQKTYLAADIAYAQDSLWHDGPTIALAAGTWLLIAFSALQASGGNAISAKIWDGTSDISSEVFATGYASTAALSLFAIVSPAASTTYRLAINTNGNTTGTFKATTPLYAAGGATASGLLAVKVA